MLFSTKLTSWYQKNKRDFPWRGLNNPYPVWLSEIILQQTRTQQGLPYYQSFINNYPTIEDLAKADETDVLKLWQGLGYYSRARNLHFTAKHIVNELKGVFPNNYTGLLKLKGIGDYTASAIASICYEEKCAVVDGNVYRVLSRYFGITTPINSTQGIKDFKLLAQKLLPKKKIAIHNQAIMDFGATICTPKLAKCKDCVFNDSCFALQKNKVYSFPVKTSKIKIKKRYFNYLVVLSKDHHISLLKRIKKDIWYNLYEFPLIETENGINLNEIIKNPILKSYFGTINNTSLYNTKSIIHKLSHQHIYTKFWIIKVNEQIPNEIPISSLKNYPIPKLIDNFIKKFNL